MSESTVAIVGSGIVGASIAHLLTAHGHDVVIFEKGPQIPYPHQPMFEGQVEHGYENPEWVLAPDLARMTHSGGYIRDLGQERVMVVGGAATQWSAITLRMIPSDFRTRTLYGFGEDWPITYDEIEPYYCRAEALIGISGTDADNPYAPPRSRPFPLPAFELTSDDLVMAERLKAHGLHLHTTPQARTRHDYGDRAGCMNYGECRVCPIGARYSPNHHLRAAIATGRCTVRSDVSVRRITTDESGRARSFVYRDHKESADREHAAKLQIVAAAGFESPRLLLLSRDARNPDGIGNRGGHVGRHFLLHHCWSGHMHYDQPLFPGKAGFWTGQSQQFCDPPGRGKHGGMKIEFSSNPANSHQNAAAHAGSLEDVMRVFEATRRCRRIAMHAESLPDDRKYVELSKEHDRFGDPVAHYHYDSTDFDRRTYDFARELLDRYVRATGAKDVEFQTVDDFGTFNHYMGTCRMGKASADSVVDTFGRVHDTPGLYVVGLSNFVGTGGAVNPTLTAAALALRSADQMLEALA